MTVRIPSCSESVNADRAASHAMNVTAQCAWAIRFALAGAMTLIPPQLSGGWLWAADTIPTESATVDVVTLQGEYRALLIGIDDYEAMPKLKSAVNDIAELRQVLVDRYGFKPENIRVLLDKDATRTNIESALVRMSRLAAPADSVLIYYAGHGQYSEDNQLAWWVPVEGKINEEGTWILDAAVRNYVASMKARHVYLIADSCFSGALFAENRGVEVLPRTVGELLRDKYYSRLYAKRSRWGLTSGSTEPVADRGQNGHSVFAYHLLKYLKENEEPYLIPSRIADQVIPLVARNANQMPRSQPLQGANDEGGQFVLRLVSVAKSLEEQQRRAEDKLKGESEKAREELKREMERLAEERKRLEADAQQKVEAERKKRQELERQLEEQRKLEADVRRRLEEEHRERLETERQKSLGAEHARVLEEQKREERAIKQKLEDERRKRAELEQKLAEQRELEQAAKRAAQEERERRLEAERVAKEAQARDSAPEPVEVPAPKKGRRVYPGGF